MTVEQLINEFGEQQVVAFFLVLARVSPLFVLAPLFSSRSVPARVRGIVAVALAIGLGPVVGRDAQVDLDVWNLAALIGKELLVGASFAFALAAFFAAIQVAGAFLDTLIGFSYGGLIDPVTGTQSAVLTQLYAFVGVAIFIAIGGDAWVIEGMARTYELVPMDAYPQLGALVQGADDAFVGVFAAAIQVAGPVVLALIVTDAAFGVVSRVVPQLNVFAVGFPAKVFVGLLLLGTTLPFVAGWIADELQRDVGAALQTLKLAG
ncbi:flagellar biosynthetic protein FliR [Paraconexibacter algicola]|uniref:Flagellar biosynthetic protein FliR n=1 Tax=Paraconexibacter algicola TaxID=2133960 RepID=A0A2T4UIW0_9ACTN|nr:flagellar biosynthetic protein FliR [Paraconexibacter algicola]PTL59145.1 flagellar biosynthetic protein FliR [Paraconexibacter algicola]